ncbi:Multicopper oxidase with three cupredoxin domains (includes cell division protein FtsP and spore coat protein CotA) [Sulfitobacter brevis]|uniref:Multicopper oxidase with three cupredoxin domains (Includes cell division protein FtsP and spore coat protein CotA) n=1 Tax=Sulfitobacter brevis TaxID=74348 RepID=A0A1I1TI89_9RHOB|nr:multicopper oxidase family protein [Sulfitobacter brevis]SFD58292.1 Multicopper oxidase with three cupredoxin domains (includes cell division protein FtsP and spore coat protein CotA) [Sulfitobacter brevis]
MTHATPLSRRSLLKAGAAFAAAPILAPLAAAAQTSAPLTLRAGKSSTALRPAPYGLTDVWSYNGSTPGPEIRVKQGERVRIMASNALDEPTTIHWHGIRTPNAMDGVGGLTQAPIEKGGEFLYEFDALDAGTFWYHPHQRSFEQVGRGLYGPLIVEEADPVQVDREVTWMLDDWRMTNEGQLDDSFGSRHDAAHGGRIGNTVTINGEIPDRIAVQSGERIRLRLINAANARIFGLQFGGLSPVVIAMDGQPVTPHTPPDEVVVLGPAMRVDLILDMSGKAGDTTIVSDIFYEELEYELVKLAYGPTALRDAAPDWPMTLTPNPLSEPDIAAATRHQIVFNGGMMGQMMMGADRGAMMEQIRQGSMWFINGKAAMDHLAAPLLSLPLGSSHIFEMENSTGWPHPIHFHGHSFRVIARNGRPTPHQEWQDTVMMAPEERVEIAFVADNPGDWMFHCHILEHQAAGMMGFVRVEV